MKASRVVPLLCAAGLIAGLLLAGLTMRHALARLDWASNLLTNPFRLSTRVTATGPVILRQVQRLSRVETCRYEEQVIVRGDTGGLLPAWLAGDHMLFLGRGEVVAGMDLGRLQPADLRVEEGRVTVRLPRAEILHTRLDSRRSEVYERRSGMLSGPDPGLETRVRIEAEERIRRAALDAGVLTTADTNGREMVREHLRLLGFREIRFE